VGRVPSLMISTSDAVRPEGYAPMPMDAQEIERLIKAAFPGAEVAIKDLAGDGDHYAAHVVAKEFAGKTRVQQHKMVYEALQGRMGGVLHALALTTAAPKD
jgi:stress-induced morphogen